MSDVGKELVRRLSLSAEITAENDALHAEVTRLLAEVERLRMTDAEREAVYWAARAANENWKDWCRAAMYDERYGSHAAKHEAREATLRALAERHGRDAE
jgi:hypothetical protein